MTVMNITNKKSFGVKQQIRVIPPVLYREERQRGFNLFYPL
jgi:hypothetical protein